MKTSYFAHPEGDAFYVYHDGETIARVGIKHNTLEEAQEVAEHLNAEAFERMKYRRPTAEQIVNTEVGMKRMIVEYAHNGKPIMVYGPVGYKKNALVIRDRLFAIKNLRYTCEPNNNLLHVILVEPSEHQLDNFYDYDEFVPIKHDAPIKSFRERFYN